MAAPYSRGQRHAQGPEFSLPQHVAGEDFEINKRISLNQEAKKPIMV